MTELEFRECPSCKRMIMGKNKCRYCKDVPKSDKNTIEFEINSIVLKVKNLQNSKSFYIDNFGAQYIKETPQMITLMLKSTYFTLEKADKVEPFEGVELGFIVNEKQQFDNIIEHLRKCDVKINGPFDDVNGRYIFLEDPDGHSFKLFCSVKQEVKMKILYVEDHAIFASQINRFLPNHYIDNVPGISQAQQKLNTENYDLLLVDYDLEDGKGDKLVRDCRSLYPKLKIIGVSSKKEGNKLLLEAGAMAICSKMEFDQIQNVIKQLCK